MKNKILFFIIIFSLSFSQDIVEIDYFYNPNISQPFITFDPINNTAYYLNEYNPQLLTDFKFLDINLNSSSLAPLGSYFSNNFYQQFLVDTISSNSFEHNRGDYAYYENTIFIFNKNDDLSTFLMGQGRSQPVYDISDSEVRKGNTLQNYFFNINKTYDYSDKTNFYLSVSSMYHKEKINIPGNFQDSSYYSRFSDSYMYGLTANLDLGKFNFYFSGSSQLMRGNHLLHIMIDEYTNWFNFSFNWNYNKYLSIETSLKSKTNSIDETLDLLDEIGVGQAFLKGKLNYNNFIAELSFKNIFFLESEWNESPFWDLNKLNFHLSYQLQKINLTFSINKKTENFINRGVMTIADESENMPFISEHITIFDIYSINIEYKNKLSKFSFEPYFLVNNYINISELSMSPQVLDINGFKSFFSFKNDYIISNVNSVIYFSDDLIPLNSYSNYSFLFSPIIKQKRFRPFIGIEGSYMDLNSTIIIDPYFGYQDIFNTSNQTNISQKVNLFTFEIGFIVKGFKLTYSFVNPLNEETSFTYDESHDSIKSFSNLKINWQFLD